jgi:hypothetical protein
VRRSDFQMQRNAEIGLSTELSTFTGISGISRNSQFVLLLFVHFLFRKRKRTKRNRPRPGALRAALRFSQPAGPVELAYAQTATGPFSPAAAMLGPGQRDINRRPHQGI